MQVVLEIAAQAVYALSAGNLIEKVGAYAGFAAVVGLAVLTALYFSQARDVKRLREWAGRAPERSAEVQAGGRTPQAAAVRTAQPPAAQATSGTVSPAQPVRPAGPGAAKPAVATAGQQAGKPATAPAGQQTGKPATAPGGGAAVPATASGAPAAGTANSGGKAATPAGVAASAAGAAPATASAAKGGAQGATTAQPATGSTGADGDSAQPSAASTGAPTASAGAATQQKPGTPAGAKQGGAAAPATQGATTAPVRGAGTGGAKVLPARTAQQRPRPIPTPATIGSQTAVIPPPGSRRQRNWTAPRYLILIIAGTIVLGLGGVVGFLALTGDDDGGSKKKASSVALPNGSSGGDASDKKKEKRNFPPAIDPATVTVAVLNGTQITGLAGTTGQQVAAAGFRLGNVATASQQTPRTESVVLYRPGQSRQARAVARKLDISQIEVLGSTDPSASLAGSANVVVIVGADKSS